MKKREITNKDLEQLFNKVIEQTPLINEEQVNSFLYNLPKAKSGRTAKHLSQNFLNTLIVGTIVLSIAVVTILWVNSGNNNERTISVNSPQEKELVPVRTDSLVSNDKEIVQNTANEDSALKISSIKIISAPIQTDAIMSVSDIYKHFDKQPQLFSIRANRDTTIICKEGTSIKIKANSFISEKSGKEVSGIVQVAVKEYYKMSDIILSNLSTTSGEKILETGGMLHISAKADNENCLIKQGNKLEIGFPYSNKKDDMALFKGKWIGNKIDWELVSTSTTANSEDPPKLMVSDGEVVKERLREEEVFVVVEEMPEFPGGTNALRKYIKDNTQYPFSALKDKIEGTVYVNFAVDRSGLTNNFHISRGLSDALNKAAIYALSQMPKWKPGMQRGKPVSVSYTVPVYFTLKDSMLTDKQIRKAKVHEEKIKDIKLNYRTNNSTTNNEGFKNDFEKTVNDYNIQEISVSDVNRYVLSSSQLGWINCDRFVDNNIPKTNYSIKIDVTEKPVVNIILHRFRSILRARIEPNRISFKDVPLGEKITIVALKSVNNKIFLAVKETVITDKEETELDFQPVTMDLLKKEMEKLNKFN